jgi:2-aminoethylphosphonate transport system ATP-binding protein
MFDGVTVSYRGAVVLDTFTLDIRAGEFMALIGPSGSGKTTALRAVAGFVQPASGRVRIGETDVTDLPPYERGIGVVVQNYALFPHMKIEDNVAFGLRAKNAPRDFIAEQVQTCLRLVGMSAYIGRLPRELSGGQQQRVAIARALAVQPRVLLLDEPLSALDAQIRRSMVEELAKLHRDLPSLTVLYVTHDQTEALTLADRIAILRNGRLTAVGSSTDLYCSPPNRFAAEFLGRANLLPVRFEGLDPSGTHANVNFAATKLIVSASESVRQNGRTNYLACVRPHALRIANGDPHVNRLRATVTDVAWQGDHSAMVLECSGTTLRLVAPPLRRAPDRGSVIELTFDAIDATLIPEDVAVNG